MDALVMNGTDLPVDPAEQDPLSKDYLAAEVPDRFPIAFTGIRLLEFMAEESGIPVVAKAQAGIEIVLPG